PLVLLGMVSFGTYLWHQPVLFFMHYIHFGQLPLMALAAGIAASVGLGALSYRLIEGPVRHRRWLARPALLMTVCGAALALPFAAGAAGYLGRLVPASMTEAARLGGVPPPNATARIIDPPRGDLAFVLYGDSHAAQYFDAAAARFGPGAVVALPSCLSAGGLISRQPDDPEAKDCRALSEKVRSLVERRGIRALICAQRWERQLFAPGAAEPLGLTNGAAGPHLLRAMQRLADSLPPDTRIILVGNAPTAAVAGRMMDGGWLRCRAQRNVTCPESYPANLAEGRKVSAMLRAFAARDPRFTYVDAAAPLCPQGRCRLVQDGRLNYWDDNHMTQSGAARVMATIDPSLISQR
ncbi:MAG: hypothetical protein NWP98_10790, partial [Erythrobacter sp.]|nr:hypothetical protein [Erythrobacter sp.]